MYEQILLYGWEFTLFLLPFEVIFLPHFTYVTLFHKNIFRNIIFKVSVTVMF